MSRKAFQPEEGLSSKTSYARTFKELITHTSTTEVAGGSLKRNAVTQKRNLSGFPPSMP